MRRYGLTPMNDPVSTLVYHGHAKDVETVMVDGELVVETALSAGSMSGRWLRPPAVPTRPRGVASKRVFSYAIGFKGDR